MFWVAFLVLVIVLIVLQFIILKKPEKEDIKIYNLLVDLEGNQVVVVDKMIEITAKRENRYILFVQLDNRKIVELSVNMNMFNLATAGDYGVIKENTEGDFEFKKVS